MASLDTQQPHLGPPKRQGRRLTPCLAFRDEGAYRVTCGEFLLPERCRLASLQTNMAMKKSLKTNMTIAGKSPLFLIRIYVFKLLFFHFHVSFLGMKTSLKRSQQVCPPQKKRI